MENTKEKVVIAAKEVFIERGYEGARMQEIADKANINKGLLHYYFKSKENIFHAVMQEVVDKLIPKLDKIIKSKGSIADKIRVFVDFYIDLLVENPYLPAFVISELNLKGSKFFKEIFDKKEINPTKLFIQIQMEIEQKKIRPINPFDLLINMVSLCVFPFVARPILKEITGLNEQEYFEYMGNRKKSISDFIIRSIEFNNNYPND